jgi:glycosyltransferase involved in cell wall biosynthesis
MKILLLNDYSTATGGAELQMLSLRQGLRDRGHQVYLFSSEAKTDPQHSLLADRTCFGTNTRLQAVSQTLNPSAYYHLRSLLRDFQPDIIHARMFMWQLSPAILPLLKHFPCLYQTAVYKAICPNGTKILPDGSSCQQTAGLACLQSGCLTPQSWVFYMIQRQMWLRWRGVFDRVVALSHGMKVKLEADGIRPVSVVYNGVPARPMRPPLPNPPTVAYAGRFVPEKGIDILIKAFARVVEEIPQARLLLAGQGAEQENLQQLAQQLGIAAAVTWLGHLSRSQLESQFNAAWVQVVPSLWAEPFGNVTTEAMMRGTAVIASAVGAQPEIVRDGETGFLVPPQDVEALSCQLKQILRDRDLAERLGQAGRDRAMSHFSEDQRTETFLDLYRQIHAQYCPQLCL